MAKASSKNTTNNRFKEVKQTPRQTANSAKCVCCGENYPGKQDHFYKTGSTLFTANDGYTPYCRNCVNQLFDYYKEKYDDEMEAFYYVCMRIDLYFDEKIYERAKMKASNLISFYIGQCNLTAHKTRNFQDTIDREIKEMIDNEKLYNEMLEANIDAETLEAKSNLIQKWGVGFSDEDYLFLENEYRDWVNQYNCSEKNMQSLVEEICLTKLMIRNKRSRGEAVDKEQKTLQELMGSSNLKPTQDIGATANDQANFSSFIKHIENDSPLEEGIDEDFEDFDGIKKYIDTWFLGHLSKMFGKQNRYSSYYETEMKKYTVESPSDFEDVDFDD